jgi:hypothetical protein
VANVADDTDIGSVELSLAEGPQAPPPPAPTPAPTPAAPAPLPTFNLKAPIRRCKKKFPKGPKRKRCIRRAMRRAGVASRPAARAIKAWQAQTRAHSLDRGDWGDRAWRTAPSRTPGR